MVPSFNLSHLNCLSKLHHFILLMPHCKKDPLAIPDISKLNLEQRIQLAIKAIDDSVLLQDGRQKLSIRKAAEAFHVARTSLRDRYRGVLPKKKAHALQQKLTPAQLRRTYLSNGSRSKVVVESPSLHLQSLIMPLPFQEPRLGNPGHSNSWLAILTSKCNGHGVWKSAVLIMLTLLQSAAFTIYTKRWSKSTISQQKTSIIWMRRAFSLVLASELHPSLIMIRRRFTILRMETVSW